ncbi:nicotinamide N-methyltransferase isoform X2 [Alosa alosa]|uniref:nicotinamide N-methyltransferase isoform X2 n=1 Tax=Alosa alosa TaxID=278164 RepID=UPI0020153BAA|nr:nicotinamide N-methyltransferase isoform X2 [Alosa alosa]
MDPLDFTEGEFYQDNFDSRAYIDTFYSNPSGHTDENYLVFALQRLSETFSSDRNRAELSQWLCKAPGCFDWTPVIQQVCHMEKESKSPVEVEAVLRQRVQSVVKCDVRLENPFHPLTQEPADCVVTSLCLEAACKDFPSYCDALRNVTSVLKPGGVLVMIGALGESFYIVAGQRFSCLRLTRSNVEETLRKLEFSILDFNVFKNASVEIKHVSDFEAIFYLVALKSI